MVVFQDFLLFRIFGVVFWRTLLPMIDANCQGSASSRAYKGFVSIANWELVGGVRIRDILETSVIF